MNNTAIYIPIFIVFIVIFSQQAANRDMFVRKNRKRRGLHAMTNALIEKKIGKTCTLVTGSWSSSVHGKIVSVNENWIEVETKQGARLVNAEFITEIRQKKEK